MDAIALKNRPSTLDTGLPPLLPDILELPLDPEWEATEVRIASHTANHLAPFEE